MNGTDITMDDIVEWKLLLKDSCIVYRNGDPQEMKKTLDKLLNDMGFLVVFVESLLKIEVKQEVYDSAREFQEVMRNTARGTNL